jgi:(p)ppGpp synthase/HD superfamily hydrolase
VKLLVMRGYAQTFPQLLNQLQQERPEADLGSVVVAFGCAMKLFSGAIRASGKTFFAHVIGTASIVTRHGGNIDMIATALLHAAYTHGDFGWRRSGDLANRRIVRAAVGVRIEELVFRYSQLRWSDQLIATLASGKMPNNEDDKAILLIRLCNELEEYLDLGLVYCGEAKKGEYKLRQSQILEICRLLGQRTLAEELALGFERNEAAGIPAWLCNPTGQPATAFLTTASYRRSIPASVVRALRKLLGRP